MRRVPSIFETKNPSHPLVRWAKANDVPSLNRLAALLDVSGPRLSQVLTRKHRPAVALAIKIANTTKIPLADLLDLTPAEIRAGVRAGWEKEPRAKRPAKRRAK